MTRRRSASGRLVIAHLFPELLNLYGDRGNVRVIEQRARWRGMDVEIRPIPVDGAARVGDVDVVVVGGGQDRQQVAAARALMRMAPSLLEAIGRGASLLAVCAGYQNLGHSYRSELVGELEGPGLFDAWTEVPDGAERLLGGVVVDLPDGSPVRALGQPSAAAAGHEEAAGQLTGFVNHSGRTILGPAARPLGRIRIGPGDGEDGDEGSIAVPGEGGLAGARVGTYLHGPVLSRNPHLADYLVLSALARHGIRELPALEDGPEWEAHVAFAERWRTSPRAGARRSPIGRGLEHLENLLGPRI